MEKRYEIRGKFGQGGRGAVYRGYDPRTKREVAIKRISVTSYDPSLHEERNRQLIKEAGALASLRHPNIVAVYDAGSDANGAFVVMELVNGKTLDELIEHAPLTWQDFRELAIQTMEALIAAQELDLIHSAIKPSNLMLTWLPSGKFQVKILNFGLATLTRPLSKEESDAEFSSIFFIPPEQFERGPINVRTDLYAMGCVYYQSLTGTYPFRGETEEEVMAAHLHHTVIFLRDVCKGIPKWACDWIMWMINRVPDDRPVSAHEALQVFLQFDKNHAPTANLDGAFPVGEVHERPGSTYALNKDLVYATFPSLQNQKPLASVQIHTLPPETTKMSSNEQGEGTVLDSIIKLVKILSSKKFYNGLLKFSAWSEGVSDTDKSLKVSKTIRRTNKEEIESIKSKMTEAMIRFGYVPDSLSDARLILSEAFENSVEHSCTKNNHSALVRIVVIAEYTSIAVENGQGKKVDFIKLAANSKSRLLNGSHTIRGRGLDTIDALSDAIHNTHSGRGIKCLIYRNRPIIYPYDFNELVIIRIAGGLGNPAIFKRLEDLIKSYPNKNFIVDFQSYYKKMGISNSHFIDHSATSTIDCLVRVHVTLNSRAKNLIVLKPLNVVMNIPAEMKSSSWEEAIVKITGSHFDSTHAQIVRDYLSHAEGAESMALDSST